MKKLTTLSAVILCSLMDAQYCIPVFLYGADSNMLSNVTFGSINNSSSVQSGNIQVYENFTSLSTDLQAGNSYPILVKGSSSSFPSDVMVFIDFNQTVALVMQEKIFISEGLQPLILPMHLLYTA